MDKLLRPKLFETETTDPNSEKLYKHWKVTFKNYLETAVPDPTHAEEDDAATREAAVETVSIFISPGTDLHLCPMGRNNLT